MSGSASVAAPPTGHSLSLTPILVGGEYESNGRSVPLWTVLVEHVSVNNVVGKVIQGGRASDRAKPHTWDREAFAQRFTYLRGGTLPRTLPARRRDEIDEPAPFPQEEAPMAVAPQPSQPDQPDTGPQIASDLCTVITSLDDQLMALATRVELLTTRPPLPIELEAMLQYAEDLLTQGTEAVGVYVIPLPLRDRFRAALAALVLALGKGATNDRAG